jgi:choline dehydrogenase
MSDSYDVIVIGSGSGGAPVVRRLVDLGARVLLLEAGGMDVNPAIHEPARVFELWNTEEDWALPSVAMASCNDRVLVMPRG